MPQKSDGGPHVSEEHWSSMDSRGTGVAYQLSRDACGLLWPASKEKDATILLQIDIVTTTAFLNKMGGTHSKDLSDLAIYIWNWCPQRNLVIHAKHLPGKENVQADWESRHLNDSCDWRLNRDVIFALEESLGPFSINLFATRTNTQLPVYCTWLPDP